MESKSNRLATQPIQEDLLQLFSRAPVLAIVPGDENWDDRFGPAGIINGNVNAIAINGTDVYAGGNFTQAVVGNRPGAP